MITVISGTNREGSNSLKLARLLVEMYQQAGEQVQLLDLSLLPADVFSPTVYKEKPEAFIKGFVEPVLAADGLHVVVPEYNGSFPGVLKYFIDQLPFPDAFEGRPTAFVGLSAGMFGDMRGVEQLQLIFGYRNAHNYPRRVFLPGIHQYFDQNGVFTDEELKQRLQEQVSGFLAFIGKLKS